MKKRKIFYSTLNFAPFVSKDIAIFEKRYRVQSFHFQSFPKWKNYFSLCKQAFTMLWNFVSTDAYICQFGGYHSFLPALFSKISGKPCIIITGGTDCVSFPSLQYGNFQKKLLGWFTRQSYFLCTHVAAVHKSLIFADYTYQDADFPHQGIRFFCKGIQTEMSEITNGYDFSFFHALDIPRKPRSFITIAGGANLDSRFRLKGIDLMVWLARNYPDCQFTIVGASTEMKIADMPDNVQIIGFAFAEQLRELLSEHQFYLQLSMSEGFPNALCEAMLCECVPIGSNVAAIPDIIGDCGFILNRKDTDLLAKLVDTALVSDKKFLGENARKRIIARFPLEKRENELLDLLNRLLS